MNVWPDRVIIDAKKLTSVFYLDSIFKKSMDFVGVSTLLALEIFVSIFYS